MNKFALPFELPNLGQDPAANEILNQNHELSSRLVTQIRLNSELERIISEKSEQIDFLKKQNQEISNSSLKNRELAQLKDQELTAWREKVTQLEKSYAELYSIHQDDFSKIEEERTNWKNQLHAYENYKNRIEKEIKPLFIKLEEEKDQLSFQLKEKEEEIGLLVQKNKNLLDELAKTGLEARHQLQMKAQEFNYRLEHMENMLEAETIKAKRLEENINKLQRRNQVLESLDDEFTIAKNRVIELERSRIDMERKFEFELRQAQSTIADLKQKLRDQEFNQKLDFEKTTRPLIL